MPRAPPVTTTLDPVLDRVLDRVLEFMRGSQPPGLQTRAPGQDYGPEVTDPRVAPVEDNLLAFLETMARQPRFTREPADDVIAVYSDVAFPLFNPLGGARFAPEVAGERTRELVASYVG